jgi:hypothetical protein
MSNKHPKLTINLTTLRQDEAYVERLHSYAMQRYTLSWAQKHYALASVWFAAADCCSRLARLLTVSSC